MLHFMCLQLDKVKIAATGLVFYFIYFYFVAISYWYGVSFLIKMNTYTYI